MLRPPTFTCGMAAPPSCWGAIVRHVSACIEERSTPAPLLSACVLPSALFASHHTFQSCLAARRPTSNAGWRPTHCRSRGGLKYTTVWESKDVHVGLGFHSAAGRSPD